MAKGMLSQEEIDALLSGSINPNNQEEAKPSLPDQQVLREMEKDALGEIANISMGTAATTLSQLVGKKVEITTPKLDIISAQQLLEEYPFPYVLINVKYKKGIEGSNMLVLSRQDGSVIVDLMMGGSGQNPTSDLSEFQISGISEAMNQMMGSAATSMSTMFSSVVDITPPQVHISQDEDEDEVAIIKSNLDAVEPLVRISFRMIIEDIIDSILLQVIPVPVAKKMADKLISTMPGSNASGEGFIQPEAYAPPRHYGSPPAPALNGSSFGTQPTFVQPARFSPLMPEMTPSQPNNLGLIYDVPLQVSVELGKATKTIKEILELGPGSIVELERLAGEPVDMIVNGKLIAKCEVVVINETFGIRITEIINSSEIIDQIN